MAICSTELKKIEKLSKLPQGYLPDLEKELKQLIRAEDANIILLNSRRCLEVIITDLYECELKRSRGTDFKKASFKKDPRSGKIIYY